MNQSKLRSIAILAMGAFLVMGLSVPAYASSTKEIRREQRQLKRAQRRLNHEYRHGDRRDIRQARRRVRHERQDVREARHNYYREKQRRDRHRLSPPFRLHAVFQGIPRFHLDRGHHRNYGHYHKKHPRRHYHKRSRHRHNRDCH